MTEESRERFAELARTPEPDLARLCLLIGCEADPQFGSQSGELDENSSFTRRLAELDALAAAVRAAGPPGDAPAAVAARLAGVLAGRAEFRGGSGAYRRLESSLLHKVLERRRGLPIMLSVVWVEVGRRAGLPVYPVALPGHFVVGVGDPEGEYVLADPFHGGRLLAAEDAAALAAQAGQPLTPELLGPAEPLDIVLRVLNNIRAWAAARPEHARVQLWAVELTLLLPRHPAQLRLERGELLVKLGDFLAGAAEMEAFAEILDAFDPESATRVRLDAKAARHRLN